MKIQVRKRFKYTLDNIKTHTLEVGVQEVSDEVGRLAISFRAASPYVEPVKKEAPENKVVAAPENKVVAASTSKATGSKTTKKQAKGKK